MCGRLWQKKVADKLYLPEKLYFCVRFPLCVLAPALQLSRAVAESFTIARSLPWLESNEEFSYRGSWQRIL
jgi:hypothetical protein